MSDVKKACVIERGSQVYYPKSIPRQRTALTTRICIFLIILLFTIDCATNENTKWIVFGMYVMALGVSFALEIIHRIILAVEELSHLQSRYESKFTNLLKDALFNLKATVALVLTIVFLVYEVASKNISNYNTNNLVRGNAFLILPATYLLTTILDLKSSSLHDSLWIAKNNGLNYGSGMAYSFFYGYLNLILPNKGTEEKGLKELIDDYAADNGIRFTDFAHRIFILIPKSLECFTSLEDKNFPSIEHRKSLADKTKTIAGVRDRVYRNSIYSIVKNEQKNEKVYVCAEYATPLKTFKEVVKNTGEHNAYYKKHQNDIILQFYLTLKKVLKHNNLSDLCEPIYYDDRDEHGEYHDVGKIILTRLKELKKQKEKSE